MGDREVDAGVGSDTPSLAEPLEHSSSEPWEFSNSVGIHHGCDTYIVSGDKVVAEVFHVDEDECEESEANARLLLAAPQLAAQLAVAVRERDVLAAQVEQLEAAIAGSPDRGKRIASLVRSATRLVQIERDDARAEVERLRAALEADPVPEP